MSLQNVTATVGRMPIVELSRVARGMHARVLAQRGARDPRRWRAPTEGARAGVSSGAAPCAVLDVARRASVAGETVLVIHPDTGERTTSYPALESNPRPSARR